MKEWNEQQFFDTKIWYHGTNVASCVNILKNGPIADFNNDRPLDFGSGVYLCPDFEWSAKYVKSLEIPERKERIIAFEFCPNNYPEFSRKFFGALDDDFAEFVFKNRTEYQNCINHCYHDFDMIGGPMSDGRQTDDFYDYSLGLISKEELYRRLLLPKENWQLVLHNQYLCDRLQVKGVYNTKGEIYG